MTPPLVRAVPPEHAPDPPAERLLAMLVVAFDAVRASEPIDLEPLRFEAYRQASTTWDDAWRVARVADVEELCAEAALQRGDAVAARLAWRSAWWLRRLLAVDEESRALSAWSDEVMAFLDEVAGRSDWG